MKNNCLLSILAALGIFCGLAFAEDRWIWSNRNRRDRSVDRNDRNDHHLEQLYDRQRDREPTTKRPIPGVPQNEDIDDYVDTDDKKFVGTRNYPYGPNVFYGGQVGGIGNGGGGGGGYNPVPGISGFGGNGILVGPSGPTGIIGRPQHYYPGAFPGTIGQSGFGSPTTTGLGNPNYPNLHPNIGGGSIYPNNAFGQPTQGGYYPTGTVYSPNGQYPSLQGNQFGTSQYPGIGQYSGNGPIYTEGYGLANLNGGYPTTGIGFPQNPYAGFNGFGGAGYTAYDQTKRKLLQAEDKNASEESRNISITDKAIDNKINKNLQKTT